MKNILFVASESVPFVKTGGLADVVGALPKYLDKKVYDVRVVIPDYACIPEKYRSKFKFIANFDMEMGDFGHLYVGVKSFVLDDITYYFVDNEHYFRGATPYGDIRWDIEKYCFFSKAALSILPTVEFKPDIIHCHDWQAGVLPIFLHTLFKDNPFYSDIRTIMTIHNMKFQGVWDIKTLKSITGLPSDIFTPDRMEYMREANMLKAGLVYANRITTVSETYAEEIKIPYYGEGLDGLLRARHSDLSGIVNGIDYEIYDPATDPKIYTNYSRRDFKKGKVANKIALQTELDLPRDPNIMMIGMVTRLTDQKGLDLVAHVIDRLLATSVQFVVLGTGDRKYEDMLRDYEWSRKDKVSANIYFNDERAHRIYAACDAILMPSLFEPCGLTQLISMRYGTVPIVRETGGLKDTVMPYNRFEQSGTGFSFANYSAEEMLESVFYAEKVFYDERDSWNALVKRGMESDYSWSSSAKKYEALYDSL